MRYKMLLASVGVRQALGFARQGQGRWVAAAPARLGSSLGASPSSETSRFITGHPKNNVPPHIAALVGRNLHLDPNHPIGIVRKKIQDYFSTLDTVGSRLQLLGERPSVSDLCGARGGCWAAPGICRVQW